MKEPCKEGRVKFFDRRNDKRFGFLSIEGGPDIFFHFGDGQEFYLGKDGPVGSAEDVPQRLPVKGDRIYFYEFPGRDNKPKASPWGFADDYDAIARSMSAAA